MEVYEVNPPFPYKSKFWAENNKFLKVLLRWPNDMLLGATIGLNLLSNFILARNFAKEVDSLKLR